LSIPLISTRNWIHNSSRNLRQSKKRHAHQTILSKTLKSTWNQSKISTMKISLKFKNRLFRTNQRILTTHLSQTGQILLQSRNSKTVCPKWNEFSTIFDSKILLNCHPSRKEIKAKSHFSLKLMDCCIILLWLMKIWGICKTQQQ